MESYLKYRFNKVSHDLNKSLMINNINALHSIPEDEVPFQVKLKFLRDYKV